jgi:ABC-type glucose/galactose transport system permease subunit
VKKKILMGSVVCIGIATVVGVGTALLAVDPIFITRMSTVGSLFGLGSVGLFFVGLATPKDDK